eukprot:9217317-Alexandrium_andersonii.AAC.1
MCIRDSRTPLGRLHGPRTDYVPAPRTALQCMDGAREEEPSKPQSVRSQGSGCRLSAPSPWEGRL